VKQAYLVECPKGGSFCRSIKIGVRGDSVDQDILDVTEQSGAMDILDSERRLRVPIEALAEADTCQN